MNKYILHWMDGTTNCVSGPDIRAAYSDAGFGLEALGTLDYFELVKEED